MISYAEWLYYRFPLSVRMVEEMLAARGIEVTYETVRPWAVKFGLQAARRIRSSAVACGDTWHHGLWRALDQKGLVLDILVQNRRDRQAAERLMRKLISKHNHAPRAMITDKLKSYVAANQEMGGLNFEHRQHKGLNNRAENSNQPTRVREKLKRRFKSPCQLQRCLTVHEQVATYSCTVATTEMQKPNESCATRRWPPGMW